MIQAIILCAGYGTRMQGVNKDIPKVMLPIGNKPVLEHTLNLLKEHGITEIGINLSYKGAAIQNYFKDGSNLGLNITYSYEEKPQGTSGALNNFRNNLAEQFFIIYGDVLSKTDLEKFKSCAENKNYRYLIGLYQVPNPQECGIVSLDKEKQIKKFLEKPENPTSNLANAGIYYLHQNILNYIPEHQFSDFGKDIFPEMLKAGEKLYGYNIDEYLIDIGIPEKYERANIEFRE